MKLLLIFFVTISQCFAIDVTPIKKGESAPQDGFFVDAENMKALRKINEEKKILTKENIKLKDLALINEQRIDTYKEFAKKAEDHASWEKTKGNFKGMGGFIIGVLATSVAAYAAIKATE